ncbi:hypothetical protein Tco_0304528 [Tanacetum coccineum]
MHHRQDRQHQPDQMLLPGAKAKRLSKNKNVDTFLRTGNYRQTRQFGNQRTMTVVGKRENVGNWDIDDEPHEQELEAHYMYMEKIQEVLHATYDNSGPTYDTEPLETIHPNDEYNVFATERQNPKQPGSINDTYDMEKVDSNATLDSSDMSTNEQGVD